MNGPTKLRAYMKRSGLTQEQLAAAADVPGPQVSLWLNRKRRPSLESAFKIERATAGEVTAADWLPSRRAHRPRAA